MNSKFSKLSFLIIIIVSSLIISSCGEQNASADLVLYNGKIVTLNDSDYVAEAIAVKNDTIWKIGTSENIKQLIGKNTEKINLKGKFVIPGFNDAHLHFEGVGQAKMKLELQKATNWNEIILMVLEASEKAKPGEWILGRGWHQEKWDPNPDPNVEGYPIHEQLSRATPYNPVMLTHASGHAVFVNTKAMELAGIDDSTKSPEGGKIVRDADGKATGVFEENAETLITAKLNEYLNSRTPEAIKSDKLKALKLGYEEFHKYGITSVTDAGSTFDDIDFYKSLADSSQLQVRLNTMLYIEDAKELAEKISGYKIYGYGNNFLSVHSIKKYIDGALGSRGALFMADYSDLPGHRGQLVTPISEMEKAADIAIENGFQLCTHAIGDKGNREVLRIYKNAFDKHPDKTDLRWRVEHAQHLSVRDIPKFGEYGVIASMQGIHCTSDAPYVINRLGSYRAEKGAYVWRDLIDSGAIICNGTDAPIESVNTINNFYALVTRRTKDDREFYPQQKMTRLEALRAYTINGAYASFEEDIKGTLEAGKLADIVVLSEDLLECADWRIPNTEIIYTILGGKIVYKTEEK
ncbi:MAG: amidohydrolase [Melioribacteraceae bacterium]|nr:amidohydrolase [Melioribacteraceae bacterium]